MLADYTEHYGLERRRLPSGRYEKVAPEHSWAADWAVTNRACFNLQRHSDHHENAGKPYHELEHCEIAPLLPGSYPFMFMLSLYPPLYFRIMNPRVAEWRRRLEETQGEGEAAGRD
jgi:alkane 1-monooxygenase